MTTAEREAVIREYLDGWDRWNRAGHGEPTHIGYLRDLLALLDEARAKVAELEKVADVYREGVRHMGATASDALDKIVDPMKRTPR